MNWTAEQVQAHYNRLKQPPTAREVGGCYKCAEANVPCTPERHKLIEAGAKAKNSVLRERMNKTEAAYSQDLEFRRVAGDVSWWKFEPVKLRLATNTSYTPDFMVVKKQVLNGVIVTEIEMHEIKGFWRDDARVKIKVAAEMYPHFKFIAVQKIKMRYGGGWKVEEF